MTNTALFGSGIVADVDVDGKVNRPDMSVKVRSFRRLPSVSEHLDSGDLKGVGKVGAHTVPR